MIAEVSDRHRLATMATLRGDVPVLADPRAAVDDLGGAGRGRGRAAPAQRATSTCAPRCSCSCSPPRPTCRCARSAPTTTPAPRASARRSRCSRCSRRRRRRAGRASTSPTRRAPRSRCDELTVHYPGRAEAGARRRLAARSQPGEIVAVTGPAAAGKSTLLERAARVRRRRRRDRSGSATRARRRWIPTPGVSRLAWLPAAAAPVRRIDRRQHPRSRGPDATDEEIRAAADSAGLARGGPARRPEGLRGARR